MKHIFGDSGALQFSERPLLKVSFTLNPYTVGASPRIVADWIDKCLMETFAMTAAPSQEVFTWLSGRKPLYLQRQVDTGDFVGMFITDWDPAISEFVWFSMPEEPTAAARLTYAHNPVVIQIGNETSVNYDEEESFADVPWPSLQPMPWQWAYLFLNGLVVAAHHFHRDALDFDNLNGRVHAVGGNLSQWFSKEMWKELTAAVTIASGDDAITALSTAKALLKRLTDQAKQRISELEAYE